MPAGVQSDRGDDASPKRRRSPWKQSTQAAMEGPRAGDDHVLSEGLLGAELGPPNSYVEVLIPSTSECDLVWR